MLRTPKSRNIHQERHVLLEIITRFHVRPYQITVASSTMLSPDSCPALDFDNFEIIFETSVAFFKTLPLQTKRNFYYHY